MPWGYAAAAAGGVILSDALSGGGDDNPVLSQAANNNLQIGADAWKWFADRQDSIRLGSDMSSQVGLDTSLAQRGASDRALQLGREASDQYRLSFAPVNQRIATDALSYDTPERRAAAAAQAQADVGSAGDAARRTMASEVQARGGDVNSGNYVATLGQMGVNEAALKAAAGNTARKQVEDTGAARLASAATLGQSVATQAANQTSLGITAGNSAVTNAKTPLTNSVLEASILGQAAGAASGANSSAANIALGKSGVDAQADGAQNALTSMAGQYLGAYAASDKNIKTGKKPVSGKKAMKAVRATDVKQWRYKDGTVEGDDGGEHVGPMAQDVRLNMGEQAAPGGKVIDLVSMNGITLSAVKDLDKRVARLEKKGA